MMIKTTKEIWFSYDLDGKNEGYPYKNTLWVSLDELKKALVALPFIVSVKTANKHPEYFAGVKAAQLWLVDKFFPSKVSALPKSKSKRGGD